MVKKNWKILLTKLENNRGSVLLTTYMLTMVLLVLGAAFLVLSSNEAKISEVQRKTTQAFYIAEAGIERAIFDLKTDFENSKDWTDSNINGWTVDKTDTDADGYYPLPDASDVANAAYPTTALGDGSYSVRLMNGTGVDDIYIRSMGTIGSVSQTIEIYVTVVSLSPWDNAIFGGSGSSGGWVNGNVNVSGSVHILGNGLDDGDNAIALVGGAKLVRNNYDGLDLHPLLEAKIPALPTTTVTGESTLSETLNAELRVKKGIVSLSGLASAAEETKVADFEDGEKESMDGAYVTDGYGGNQGASNVYSDNGATEAYDLGDAVTFPGLDDPYPDNPSQDYYEYFADNALVLTNELSAVTPASSFTLGNCATNCITMDGSGTMVVQGMIYLENGNDLSITGPIIGGDITYTGTGSILVTGSTEIDANLVTPVPAAGQTTFPDNILGIMTPNDISMGNGAQREVMGLFYAEGEVSTNMQTILLGTIVANQFNITNQVPKIFQVPEVSNNLPPGMISGDDVYFMKVVSWQKI